LCECDFILETKGSVMLRSFRHLLVTAVVTVAALAAVPATAALAASADGAVVGLPVAAPGGVAGTDTTITFPYGGTTRSYTVFVPNTLPAGPRPVLVVLHHYSGTGAIVESAFGFDAGAAVNGALVVYPEGVNRSWNSGTCCGTARDTAVDDTGFLDAVISDVEARHTVDALRIAMGGFSNGGAEAYRYACERSDRVKTFFVGSGIPIEPTCSVAPGVGILHMHGLLDLTVPWNGTTTSPLIIGGFLPPVKTAVTDVATHMGCRGWTTKVVSGLLTRYTAANCPPNATLILETVSSLPHKWVTGAAAKPFGLDETGATWSFMLSRWATLPPPIAA
jgi:polyhydroxybutyrate depolymerase